MQIDEQHIIAYVEGTLTTADAGAVEQAVEQDAQLKELLALHQMIADAREHDMGESLKSHMSDWQSNAVQHDEHQEPHASSKTAKWTWIIVALMGLCALIGGYQYFQPQPQYDQLVSSYYEAAIPDFILTPMEEPFPIDYQTGIDLYKAGKYKAAEQAFSRIAKSSMLYEKAQVMQLHSLFLQKKFTAAEHLAAIVSADNSGSQAAQESDWLRTLALIATNRKPAAIEHLKLIAAEQAHTHNEKAQKLLEELQ